MSSTSSGIGTSAASLTSWTISSIGKSGARSSGPTGCPVPGWSTGDGRFGMSAATLYQRVGSSDSGSTNFVCSIEGDDTASRHDSPVDELTRDEIDELLRGELVGRIGVHAAGETYVVP